MNKPTLSVTISNYNHSKYISDALEAISGQSYKPMEILIIDDASTDNSVEVIQRFIKHNSNIRLIINEKNMGVLYNSERLFDLARGDYIYGAAADDKIYPGFFEKTMSLLEKYPQAGLCCSDPVFFDDRTGVINKDHFNVSEKPCYINPESLVELMCKSSFWIAGHTSIVKRSCLFEAGGFIPELKWYCDWFASLAIAFKHGICYIPEHLASLRIHSVSFSASGRKNYQDQREVLRQTLEILKRPQYADILLFFQRSGMLSMLDPGILRLIAGNPEYWMFLSLPTVKKCLKNKFSNMIPSSIKKTSFFKYLKER